MRLGTDRFISQLEGAGAGEISRVIIITLLINFEVLLVVFPGART